MSTNVIYTKGKTEKNAKLFLTCIANKQINPVKAWKQWFYVMICCECKDTEIVTTAEIQVQPLLIVLAGDEQETNKQNMVEYLRIPGCVGRSRVTDTL